MKGKANWEHLNDELHVLITVEDTKNRAEVKLKRAVEEIIKLFRGNLALKIACSAVQLKWKMWIF